MDSHPDQLGYCSITNTANRYTQPTNSEACEARPQWNNICLQNGKFKPQPLYNTQFPRL